MLTHWRTILVASIVAAQVLSPALPATSKKTAPAKSRSTSRASTPSRPSLAARQRDVAAKKRQVQSVLRVIKRQQSQAGRSLSQNRTRLARAKHELRQADTRLVQARAALDKANEDLRAAEKRLAEHTAAVKARLRMIYVRSHAGPLQAIGEKLSFAHLASRGYILQRVARHDLDLLDQIQEDRDRVAEHRRAVEQHEAEVARLRNRAASKRTQVANLTAADERQVRQLRSKRYKYECDLAAIEKASREIEAMLRRLQRSPARQMQPWRGKFIRPCTGSVTSKYGYRTHPIYKIRHFHTGVDIGAPAGAPIYAAGDGTIVHAARWGGYGNVVIIDHGGGLSTLYAHCSRIHVKSGQKVKRGRTIARVGSTGIATGPHLHFEVRRNGKHVNPLQ